jgi:hypothetical protein
MPPDKKCDYCQSNNLPCPDYIILPLHPLIRDIKSIRPDPKNTNKHTKADVTETAKSIKKFKQRGPIILNDFTGYIEAGEGRWLAMKTLGYKCIAVAGVSDTEQVAMDYSIADNATGKGSEFDWAKLQVALGQLEEKPPGVTDDIEAKLFEALRDYGDAVDNPLDEWGGMPEFNQEDNFGAMKTVIVHFETEADIEDFSKLIDQKVTPKTKSLFHPKREDEDLKLYLASDES